MKILIVDDKKEDLYLLETMLKGRGYEVVSAINGSEALEILYTEDIDMIISDILMPVMDGLQLCRRVKLEDELRDITFIFYTATYIDEKDEELALKMGADKFIRKPLEPDVFMETLQRVIRDIETREIRPKKPRLKEEEETFNLYSERLVNKLEKKMLDLEREITERKNAEKALQKSEERYKTMFENMSNAVAIYEAMDDGNDFVFVNFNKAGENIDKIKREEIIGKSLLQTFPGIKEFGLFEVFQRVWSTGNPEHYPVAQYKDERISGWRENFVYKLPSGDIVAIYSDETRQKQAEEALRKSEEKYHSLVEYANDAILIVDIQRNIISWNRAAETIFGYNADEIMGKSISLLIPERFAEKKKKKFIKAASEREQANFARAVEYAGIRKDGSEFPAEVSYSSLETKGEIYYTAIVRDISERKEMEYQLLQAEKLKSLGELAGGVAHNFNNLLSVILGNTQLLKMSIDHPPGIEERRIMVDELSAGLNIIEKASKDAAETVMRIQEFSREEIESIYTQVDINELITNALDYTRTKWKDDAESKGIKIKIHRELSSLPPTVGSASELREVFTDLINNAIDAMPQGGNINIKTYTDDHHVYVEVGDTGVGIPEYIKDRVFDPFFTTKGIKFSGLGLSASYGIISRHRGTIEVDTTKGQGTTFTIILPIHEKTVKEEKVKPISTEIKKARILIIEDEEEVRDILSEILTRGGHEVEIAFDGIQGIEIFGKKEFDLVFTDLGMPEMSGWQVAEKIKSINRKTPVILITGWDIKQEEAQMKDNWVDLIIHKPFEMNQLLNVVQDSLND